MAQFGDYSESDYPDQQKRGAMTPQDFAASAGQNNVGAPEKPVAYSTAPPAGWAPAAPGAQTGTAAPVAFGPGRTSDDTQINAWLSSIAGQPGVNPSVANDPAYWNRRIKETGGLGADNTDYWMGLALRPEGAPEGGGGGGGTPGAAGAQPSAPYVPGQGVSGMGTVFTGGGLGDKVNPMFDLLMRRANGDPNVSANDPIIRSNVDSFNATQQRAERDYESQLAERLGPNTNMGKERRMGAERIGSNTAGFEAQMMNQERTARRQEIQQALQGAYGFLTQQQQLMLQEELSQLGLSQSAYQFDVNDQFRNSPLGS